MDISYRFEGYEIIEQVGIGTTSTVFKARDIHLDRIVALKVIHPELASNKEFLKRFYQEARAIASVDHSVVVKIYHISHDTKHPFFVEEFVDGITLEELKRERSPVFPEEVVFFLLKEILEGLKAVHERGIVHRDLKPENIIITSEGKPKILDFGLAHLPGVERLTQPGSLLGSLPYSSPEQLLGKEVSPSSDIFSLGVIAYELITSHHPFSSSSELSAILKSMLNNNPVPPSKYVPWIDPDSEKILIKMIEKSSKERYENCDGLILDIEKFLDISNINWKETFSQWLNKDLIPQKVYSMIADEVKNRLIITVNPIDREELLKRLEKLGKKLSNVEIVFLKYRRLFFIAFFILLFLVFIFLAPRGLNYYGSIDKNFFRGVSSSLSKKKSFSKKRITKSTILKKNRKSKNRNLQAKRENLKKKIIPARSVISHGILKVFTFPWAEVYIDGEYYGKTPFLSRVNLPPGKHRIELRQPYVKTVTKEVDIQSGKTREIRVRLEFLPSYIKIESVNAEKIFVNGKEITAKELKNWLKVHKNVTVEVVRGDKRKICKFSLLPGERKVVSCSP